MALAGPNEAPRRTIGVREVAAQAGVSIGTVSNVLNRPAQVSPDIRELVESVMQELGFVPSRAAGQLRSRRSGLIGVVVPDVGNPFWASVVRGIEMVLDNHQLTMLVNSTRQDPDRQQSVLQAFQSQGVDGLIIAPINGEKKALRAFRNSHFGLVALGIDGSQEELPSVNLDSREGAHLAMSYLLSRGHRKIGMINGPTFVAWCADRRAGAIDALKEFDLDPRDCLEEITVADLTVSEGEQAAGRFFDRREATAILCVNDMLALGAIREANRRDMAVPQDVSIIGYDDADFSGALAPPLTTIYQPSFDMGEAAAKLLFAGEEIPGSMHVQFKPLLVARKSVADMAPIEP